ncbi:MULTISPECIES: hypothetical protein [Paracoccus]|uniref:Uncharacterized protein n=1 Tax=Paracoccus versutus TaxID=34007 RepID=A0AAQ0HG29_PARVE|nr:MULTISPECIES: hypothetical protein [Paracoccus]MBT0782738.1 hypothetical protein [Paracoccus sp. pheM1]MCJ1899983.1 hypothetical protein [Paracoccus versutus]MDF3904411.1 hypothetical protein [Paracoccus sp. AS002]REG44569.1 hypothetical protein ATH84_102238 [Paracoccus versutus]
MSGSDPAPRPGPRALDPDQLKLVAGGVTEGPDGKGCTEPRKGTLAQH